MSIQEKNYSLGRAARTTTTLGMAGLVLLGGAALGAPAMAADAAPAGDVSAAVASSHHHGHEVTLQAPRQATEGDPVTLKGKVKKTHHHKTPVKIQEKHGKKWKTLDHTKTSKKGKFHTHDVLKGKTTVVIRAKAKGHGTSATQKVTLTKASNGNGTPTQPGQSGPSGVTPGGGTNNPPPPPPPPDPMSITVPAGKPQALRDAITQAPNGATLHLSGQYLLTTDMPGPKDTGYAAGVVIDKALTLDGGKLKSDGSDNVVDVTKSGDLTLTGGITITGGKANPDEHGNSRGGGIYNDGAVDIKNADITDNHADYGGGIENHKTLTMEGGSIENNTAADENGGGVDNAGKDATFTLNGGEISHNHANGHFSNGGGISNDKGTVTLNGGSIKANTTHYGSGAGIYNLLGIVDLYGGEITGNTAAGIGGGIFIFPGPKHKGELKVRGKEINEEGPASPFVHGNKAVSNYTTDNIFFG
jgi:hypothetical protein